MAVPENTRHISELDNYPECKLKLTPKDHPGFTDEAYRKRRNEIAEISNTYRNGLPIPRISYLDEEKDTWKKVFKNVENHANTYACKEYKEGFDLLTENGIFKSDDIPHLQEVSSFLKGLTGFTLRPVGGFVSPRQFLAGLAYRVFHTTQFIRHKDRPDFTFEPDACHDLLGHAPLLTNPKYADYYHYIGLASIGASDADILKLISLNWFTIEYGLCRQDNEVKVYGAALLSSSGEIEHWRDESPEIRELNSEEAATLKYPFTKYQPIYYVVDSLESMIEATRKYADNIHRPVNYTHNQENDTLTIVGANGE